MIARIKNVASCLRLSQKQMCLIDIYSLYIIIVDLPVLASLTAGVAAGTCFRSLSLPLITFSCILCDISSNRVCKLFRYVEAWVECNELFLVCVCVSHSFDKKTNYAGNTLNHILCYVCPHVSHFPNRK